MLKHLAKVRVEFNAFDARAGSAAEFLAQCKSRKARMSNPDCDVTVKRRTDNCVPRVMVIYNNGKEEMLDASVLPAQQIRKQILKNAEMMETEQLFRQAGLEWPVIIPDEEIKLAEQQKKEK
ncbi:hypothetical protein O6H91_19G056800 [Diphasiastrum complanatum]|uniref:Uncharacterized protein n=1 Tax=Diphasiastrum complanatum TaxID=34168 RepID=A0ACC2AVI2_DIPCM|nr:hypothetical protein O6H91_19G056800 [Diphasiastrum complanatum]